METGESRQDAARAVWRDGFPVTERGLADEQLAFFTYHLREDRPRHGRPPTTVGGLLDEGWVRAEPIVYEDFLPRSAAGIFQSNLSDEGTRDNSREGARYDLDWLAGAIDREIHDPFALYQEQRTASIGTVAKSLDLPGVLD